MHVNRARTHLNTDYGEFETKLMSLASIVKLTSTVGFLILNKT